MGGNSSLGLPVWSDTYNQIIFQNLRTCVNIVADTSSYFGGSGNIFDKYIYENDTNFNTKNYLQLTFEGGGLRIQMLVYSWY